ncbi:flagellar basal body P-ring formation chaperone FlgA [Candidatus Latescibacterota bacterium]
MKKDTKNKLCIMLVVSFVFIMWLCPVNLVSADIVRSESIREAVVDTLTAYAERNDLDIEVIVPVVSHIAVQGVDTPIIRVNAPAGGTLASRVMLEIDLLNNEGEIARSVNTVVRIKSYKMVTVAADGKNRGDMIKEHDIIMKKMDITRHKGYFSSPEELEGMRATRKLKAGTILSAKNVEPVPVISRGDRIIMKACVGHVVITAHGTAREDGILNETIRVYNEATKKYIPCTVLDSKTVLVCREGG